MYCSQCGNSVQNGSMFCTHCGNKLKTEHETKEIDIVSEAVSVEKYNVDEMIEYLDAAKTLEIRIYSLNRLIDDLKRRINNLRTKKIPDKKTHRTSTKTGEFFLGIFVWLILVPLSLIITVNIVSSMHLLDKVVLFIPIAFGVGLGICLAAYILCGIYNLIISFIDDIKYSKILKDNDALYRQDLQRADILEKQEKELISLRKEVEANLEKLYSYDILFHKYRNMIAVITIHEYYESGRCCVLKGHEGAYNIFESELRQNIIINSLDNITNLLTQIKQNQYMLYRAIQELNSEFSSMSSAFDSISSQMSNISSNSAVAAYNSRVAAENTRITAYMSVLK